MTAIGLLCRMYLGWTHENASLASGIDFFSQTGPSPGDIYYDYYATQVLHHWGGSEWQKWNEALRDRLIETQVKRGRCRRQLEADRRPRRKSWRAALPDLPQHHDSGSLLPVSASLSKG